jgi:hypothetical protein
LTFTRSGNTGVGVLYGHRGIGKSSVLRHLEQTEWPSEGCEVILADLSESSATLNIGEDYYTLPHIERWHRAMGVASLCLNTHIDNLLHTFRNRDIPFPIDDFIDLMRVIQPALLPLNDIYSERPAAELLDKAQAKDETAFRFFFLYFLVRHRNQYHIKFVLDNLDDKDSVLIKALCEQLAHLRSFFHACSAKEMSAFGTRERRMTPIVSCRPITYTHLKTPVDQENGDDWYGLSPIPFTFPCSLAAILIKRYDFYVAGERPDSRIVVDSELLGGNRVTIDSRDRLFRRLCNDFGTTGQAQILLSLCNYDLARAAAATLEVFRNRHFLSTDAIISMTTTSQRIDRIESAKRLFTSTTIIRILAYGNQATEAPMYPIMNTLVPNILDSLDAPFARTAASFVKPRIITYFLEVKRRNAVPQREDRRNSEGNDSAVTRGMLLEDLKKCFGLREPVISQVIDEMFGQELLAHNHGVKVPSYYGARCELIITPRAECLWTQLSMHSVLLQAYREFVELNDNVSWRGVEHSWSSRRAYAIDMSSGEVFSDLVWMCVQSWVAEKEFLERLLERNVIGEFVRCFGSRFTSEQLVDGVQESARSFWKGVDSTVAKSAGKILIDLREEMAAKHTVIKHALRDSGANA